MDNMILRSINESSNMLINLLNSYSSAYLVPSPPYYGKIQLFTPDTYPNNYKYISSLLYIYHMNILQAI